MNPTAIAAYLALFATVGFLFLFAALLVGRLLRAQVPNPTKLETYECGEPPVGPNFVQFDLRFYVVALVFIIFEVEVAFFFPWATVFGKATELMGPGTTAEVIDQRPSELGLVRPATPQAATAEGTNTEETNGTIADNKTAVATSLESATTTARQLALASMVDMGAFFAVLLVGFAYVWFRGDLDWVRAYDRETTERDPRDVTRK